MATAAFPTRDDFAALLNDTLGGEDQGFEGRVVKGTVTGIENDMVVIDVGLKSEGRVPLREFATSRPEARAECGRRGRGVRRSRREQPWRGDAEPRPRARREAAWDTLEHEFAAGNRVDGVIFGRVKGASPSI